MNKAPGPIGIFDSGIGGLTVFKAIKKRLPQYDYVYLGDNARVPYGTRSFETVYRYTKEGVWHLFDEGCRLVIIACNSASAKALRNIQQLDLVREKELHRVLGVIRPTTEIVGGLTKTRKVGILATSGTVNSNSYQIEINKFFPDIEVFQQACPLWVPLVENNEHEQEGADYFVKKYVDALLQQNSNIDVVILGCTHYPLLERKIANYLPMEIKIISQGEIVAQSLESYLHRHPEIDELCSKGGNISYQTTESPENFNDKGFIFLGEPVNAKQVSL